MSIPAPLAGAAGKWTGVYRLWFSPEAPVIECATTAEIGMAGAGRFFTMRRCLGRLVPQQPSDDAVHRRGRGNWVGERAWKLRGAAGSRLGMAHGARPRGRRDVRHADVQHHAGRTRGIGSRSDVSSLALTASATSAAVRAALSRSGIPGPR